MIKKFVKMAVLGGALLGMAVSANAAQTEINIYGASAQFKFWQAASEPFLTNHGCTGTVSQATDGSGYGISYCDEMNGESGSDFIIRYSSKASVDGIYGVQGTDPLNSNLNTTCAANERMMVDAGAVDYAYDYAAEGAVDIPLTCTDVTVGASDVAAETFNQESHGLTYGPRSTSNTLYEDRSVKDVTVASGYTNGRPVVVPFAFFVNADPSDPVPFTNVSRLMATSLFSGQVTNWSAFDSSVDMPVVLCLRHAGSGTHATLDAAVMRGDYSLVTTQVLKTDLDYMFGVSPETYFNNGSSDLMRCVGGGGGKTGYDSWSGIGAVGYADADKVKMTPGTSTYKADYGYVRLMSYMGEYPNDETVKNGLYDFWSAQWLYYNSTETETNPVSDIEALINFASDAYNLDTYVGKGDYWASQGEMNVEKISDYSWPVRTTSK